MQRFDEKPVHSGMMCEKAQIDRAGQNNSNRTYN